MKNSVFYGSGIQRFYNQELDKYRRKFIELEEDKHRWLFLVCFFFVNNFIEKINTYFSFFLGSKVYKTN